MRKRKSPGPAPSYALLAGQQDLEAFLAQVLINVRYWVLELGGKLLWDEVQEVVAHVLRQATDLEGPVAVRCRNKAGTIAIVQKAILHYLSNKSRYEKSRDAISVQYEEHLTSLQEMRTDALAMLEYQELLRVVDGAIRELRHLQREVYVCIERRNMTYEDASAALDITVAQAQYALLEARAAVAAAVKEYYREPNMQPPRRFLERALGRTAEPDAIRRSASDE